MKPLPFALCLRSFLCAVPTAGIILIAACNDSPSGSAGSQKIIRSDSRLFDAEEARTMLTAAFPAATDSGKGMAVTAAMKAVYLQAGYKPIWMTEDGLGESAQSLLTDLSSLQDDGINPARYHLAQLNATFGRLKKGGATTEAIAFDTACTRAYLQASRDLLLGVLNPRRADSLWFHSNDSDWNAVQPLHALSAKGKYTQLAGYRSAIPTYAMLREAYQRYIALDSSSALRSLKAGIAGKATPDSVVQAIIRAELPWLQADAGDSLSAGAQAIRGFQQYYGLLPTGRLDSLGARYLALTPDTIARRIAANMERIRWMPRSLEAQHVLVDIPLMELAYRRDGSDAFHMRVVVGKPSRQTPSLNAAMANVVFSPAWGVPPTILKQDVLPGISKRGGNYLARKGLHAYDRHGKQISASAITAKNYRNYTYKQPPGARNALGEVKFNLPNRWDIYLHDTPHRDDFPKRYRAKSSGCVRVEKPREFAEFILRDIEGRDKFDQVVIDSIIQTRKTRYEILKTKIPVHIVYLTALEDSTGNHIRLLPDIYGRDAKLMAMLAP